LRNGLSVDVSKTFQEAQKDPNAIEIHMGLEIAKPDEESHFYSTWNLCFTGSPKNNPIAPYNYFLFVLIRTLLTKSFCFWQLILGSKLCCIYLCSEAKPWKNQANSEWSDEIVVFLVFWL